MARVYQVVPSPTVEPIPCSDATRAVPALDREGLDPSPLTRAVGNAAVQLATLVPGGRIDRHRAAARQLLAVVSGSGVVSGEDGREVDVGPGEAVLWRTGELLETRSSEGLLAVIVEGADLLPVASPA